MIWILIGSGSGSGSHRFVLGTGRIDENPKVVRAALQSQPEHLYSPLSLLRTYVPSVALCPSTALCLLSGPLPLSTALYPSTALYSTTAFYSCLTSTPSMALYHLYGSLSLLWPSGPSKLFLTVPKNNDVVLLFREIRFAEKGHFAKQRNKRNEPPCFAK